MSPKDSSLGFSACINALSRCFYSPSEDTKRPFDLPPEILTLIFLQLSEKDLLSARAACFGWNEIIKNSAFLRQKEAIKPLHPIVRACFKGFSMKMGSKSEIAFSYRSVDVGNQYVRLGTIKVTKIVQSEPKGSLTSYFGSLFPSKQSFSYQVEDSYRVCNDLSELKLGVRYYLSPCWHFGRNAKNVFVLEEKEALNERVRALFDGQRVPMAGIWTKKFSSTETHFSELLPPVEVGGPAGKTGEDVLGDLERLSAEKSPEENQGQ